MIKALATVICMAAALFVISPSAQAAPFSSCSQAEAAGAAPLYTGQPGYSSKLDRDGDGVACEQGSGAGGYAPAMPFVPAPAAPAPPVVAAPAPPADAGTSASTPTETCTDWMKLRTDPATGQERVCGPIGSPAYVYYWIPAGPMPGGVHDAGSPCPGTPLFTFARSTDNYQIWCAEGTNLLLPGGASVTNPPQPIWALYSP